MTDAREFRERRRVVPIVDNGEPLVAIPLSLMRVEPHPYVALGAPYGHIPPFSLRRSAVLRLEEAQRLLRERSPEKRLFVYDAYRPVAVQRFMIEHTANAIAASRGFDRADLSPEDEESVFADVYQLWAPPTGDPAHPTPHSTGGAVDLSLADAAGVPIDMGSDVDGPPPQCLPDYYRARVLQGDPEALRYDRNRSLLQEVMEAAGFHQLPTEWWHFSFGDQSWALIEQSASGCSAIAMYGAVPE